jgi:hypothetical protein
VASYKSYTVVQYGKHKIKRIAEKKYLLILYSEKWSQYILRSGIYLKPLLTRFYKVVNNEKQYDLFEVKPKGYLTGLKIYETKN